LKIIFLESDAADADDEPAGVEGKENEHKEAAGGGEGTTVGTTTASSEFSSPEEDAGGGVAVGTASGGWIPDETPAPGSEEASSSLSLVMDG